MSFFPGETSGALLTFEDQWPSWRTDHDHNDVAVRVHYRLERDARGDVVKVVAVIDPVALGGDFSNGLGLVVPAPRGGVTAQRRVGDGPWEALALEPDGRATVVVSSNLRELFGNAAGPINVAHLFDLGVPDRWLSGQRIELQLDLATPAAIPVSQAPFDVFIFRAGNLGHQIHFPHYAGTAAMDRSLFASALGGFVSPRKLPAALNLMTSTRYPREGRAIWTLFPGIIPFAQSGGSESADFYEAGVLASQGYDVAAAAIEPVPPADDACVVDPCDDANGGCDPLTLCSTRDGAVVCGPCPSGYSGDGEQGCVDVDECAADNGGCGADGLCANTVGAFACWCGNGLVPDGQGCADVDECETDRGGCSPFAACRNLAGGHGCECAPGFVGNGVTCVDVDECAAGTDACAPDALCSDLEGSHACSCPAGFTGDGLTACVDVDECAAGTAGCSPEARCENTPGSFRCVCGPGLEGDGRTCTDVDECARDEATCAGPAVCVNIPGGHRCDCPAGFVAEGDACVNVDECATGAVTCAANATCHDQPGSHACVCDASYGDTGQRGACVPHEATLVMVAGHGQVIARRGVSGPLTVATFGTDPVPGVGVRFTLVGPGSLDPFEEVREVVAVSGPAELASVRVHAGDVAGDVVVVASGMSGAGGVAFQVHVEDFTPALATLTPLSAGAPTRLEFTIVDPHEPPFAPLAPLPEAERQPLQPVLQAAPVAIAPQAVLAASAALAVAPRPADDVASGDTPIDLRLTVGLAPGSASASARTTADSPAGLAGRTFPPLTSAAPEQTLTIQRRDVSPGRLTAEVRATDAHAGPMDVRAVSLDARGLSLRQISNNYGATLHMAYNSPAVAGLSMAAHGDSQVYLQAVNPAGHAKLFQYTVTTDSFRQISDINPGRTDRLPHHIVMSGDDVYFVAEDAQASQKLFRYDGSSVTQVSNTRPGLSDGVSIMVPFAGGLVFSANDETGSQKLYWSGGSMATRLTNLQPGASDSVSSIQVYQDQVYFVARPLPNVIRLYRWSGSTAPGSITEIPGPRADRTQSDAVSALHVYGSRLYFNMANAAGQGKLFSYDGATLRQVSNTRPTSSDGAIPLAVFNSKLYFVSSNAESRNKLFSYDVATGAVIQVSDTRPTGHDDVVTTLYAGAYSSSVARSSTHLFFVARDPQGSRKVFQLSASGVSQVPSSNPGGDDDPTYLSVVNDVLVYSAVNASGLSKVFRWDGATHSQLGDLNPGEHDVVQDPRVVGGTLLFWARNADDVRRLWRTDGTSAPVPTADTTASTRIPASRGTDAVTRTGSHGGLLYLNAYAANGALKLHASDGFTVWPVVSTGYQGAHDSPDQLVDCGGRLHFVAADRAGFTRLWAHDGARTWQVTQLNPGGSDGISGAVCFRNALYFPASVSSAVVKLFSYDGATLRQVSQLRAATASDGVTGLAVWNDALYFRAARANGHQKLFRFDGTTITQLSDFFPSSSDGQGRFMAAGGRLYVTAIPPGSTFLRLFRYEDPGFRQITAFSPTASDVVGASFVSYQDRTYFSATVSGTSKLYADDGTRVTQVSNLNPGGSDEPGWFAVYGDHLWLSARDQENAARLFRFDGETFTRVSDRGGPQLLLPLGDALYLSLENAAGFPKLHRVCDPAAGCAP